MTRQNKQFAGRYRYELVHGDHADFIAYQRNIDGGVWQTVSTWMIPRANS
ncbi:hypothetical protein [Bradyrhizobium sp. LTSPM299]|nr:hypothetical protein [Bradyrhizobium sp. LTSPM299]